MNQKRGGDAASQARRQSLHDQRPAPGFIGQMWHKYVSLLLQLFLPVGLFTSRSFILLLVVTFRIAFFSSNLANQILSAVALPVAPRVLRSNN
jgi:hypothetical protein